jgi:hypothetical protein
MVAPAPRARPLGLRIVALLALCLPASPLAPPTIALSALALSALAPVASAAPADPQATAFRKLAKTAEKAVKQELALAAKTARTALKDELAALAVGDIDLDAALTGAVDAVLVATKGAVDGAVAHAEQLAQDGAGLLESVADPAADFRDGGAGTWDRTLDAMERQLDGLDKKLRAGLRAFAKGVTLLGKKAGPPRAVRWEFFGHDRRLRALQGPALVAMLPALPPPLEASSVGPQVLLQVQIAELGSPTRHRFGGMALAQSQVQLDLQFADGETQSGALQPVTDGLFAFDVTPDDITQGPIAFELLAGEVTDRGVFSPPHLTAIPSGVTPLLKQFKKDLASSLKTSSKILSQRTRGLKKGLSSLGKQHKQGQLAGAAALSNALDAFNAHLLAEGIALDGMRTAPVINARDALHDFGLADAAVPAGFLADGGGLHTSFLEKLARKTRAADASRGRSLERFVLGVLTRAGKQGEPLGASFRTRRRDDLTGVPLQVVSSAVDVPDRGPVVNVAMLIQAEDVRGPMLEGYVHGTIETGSSSVVVTVDELPGAQVALDPLVAGLGGRWGITLPDLDGVPVVGRLFRARSENTDRSDLIVLVTPGVLEAAPEQT